MRLLPLSLLLALVACSAGKDAPADTADTAEDGDTADTADTDDTGPALCDVTLDATQPASGAADAYHRSPIEFFLSDPDPTATVTAPVAGTTAVEDGGQRIVFTPDEPLASSTAYTFTLNYCGGSVDLEFTTSSLGSSPLPVDLTGKTWAVWLADGRPVGRDGVGRVLVSHVTSQVLVGVTAHDRGTLALRLAQDTARDGVQNYCVATDRFDTVDFAEDPYFAATGGALDLMAGDVPMRFERFDLDATVSPDGTYFAGGRLFATVDTRGMDALLDGTEGPATFCDLAAGMGSACAPCADGEAFCLPVTLDNLIGTELPDTAVVAVAADDCAGCADGPPDTCE